MNAHGVDTCLPNVRGLSVVCPVFCCLAVHTQVVSSESNGRVYYVDEVDEEKRPFKALLDVGIRSTSTG